MSEHRKTWVVLFVLATLAVAGVTLFWRGQRPLGQGGLGDASDPKNELNEAARSHSKDRFASWDVTPSPSQPAGKFPLIQKDANLHVKSVAEAIDSGQHPERLSPLIEPAAFDSEAFAKSPEYYLNVVEPGRVWQVAQPGPNVNSIKPRSPYMVVLDQGETASLRVQVSPKAPVTFTSFDGGSFQNLLTSITVQADAEGFASAQLIGTTGVVGDVHVLAGSPVDSGQVRYLVNVKAPKLAAVAK